MSYSATVTINDTATPEVKARIASFGRPLNSVMGRAVVNLWQRNFLKWNQDNPNKLGGTRTNLGAQFAKATQFQILADGFVVTTNHVAARQRLEGGTIKPVTAKMLAIPATPEAYGKRPREFNNLRFAILGGFAALVEAAATKIASTKKGFKAVASALGNKVFYWLARSVDQKADPTVLPTEAAMIDAALEAAKSTMDRVSARGGSLA
jgi:hypothetical protein